MKNKNLSSTKDWIPIANVTIDEEGKFSISVIDGLESEWDTTVTISGAKNGISTKPTSLVNKSSEESNGLLKVLRDTKHYYSLNITGNGNTDRQAGDESIYAYRQITDIELAKCVSVIVADAIYQTGIPTYQGGLANYAKNYLEGSQGQFLISHYGGFEEFFKALDKCTWSFNKTDYIHKFVSGSSSTDTKLFDSQFIIYSNDSGSEKGIKENTLYYLPALDLTINHESGLSSYKRVLNYEVGQSGTSTNWSLTIKDITNTKTLVSITNNKSEFQKNFPYDLGTAHATPITKVDTNLPIYSSPWWN